MNELNTSDSDKAHFREQLLKAEARFRIVCDAMPAGLLVLSNDGVVQFVNRKTEKIFALSSDEIVGESLFSLLKDSDEQPFSELLREAEARGGLIELNAQRGDGSVFPIELSLREFEMADRSCLLATAMDITDRREIERLKQELIAMVSHDLATPLSSIQVTLNLLSAGACGQLTERGESLVMRAERSAGQLIKLINDLLTAERFERGKVEIFPEDLDIDKLLSDAINLVADAAGERAVSINCRPTALRITADGERLKQVVTNFLGNAIKFSPANAGIEVRAEDTGEMLEISVSDHGRGVPAKDQKRIFERFEQVDAGDAREKGGRGLGLAICKAIIEQHGGTIGVNSQEGCGSTFWFRVPKAGAVPNPPS
ncbi:MAG TPA: ATP-binding protein [Chroococcales cyanobacterium]